jgi:hypothetical protein
MFNTTAGLDGKFYWFIGVVENVNDPEKLGRVRVRTIGKDTHDLSSQPSENLPWIPTTRACNVSKSSHDITPEDWVTGYYMDGAAMQHPLITGMIPGIKRADAPENIGFSKQLTEEEKQQEPVPAEGQVISGKQVDTISGVPLSSRGEYEGTLVAQTNKEVVHVCDIATQLKQSVFWERLKHTEFVSRIRLAIQEFMKLLGNSPDSISQKVVDAAKWLRRQLKDFQDRIKQLDEYLQITVEAARLLKSIVDWISSLPARLKSALSTCLSAFLSGLDSILGDVLTLPSASGSDISSALNEVKSAVAEVSATVTTVSESIAVPAQIASTVVTPSSITDVATIQTAVTSYITQQTETNQSALNIVTSEKIELA